MSIVKLAIETKDILERHKKRVDDFYKNNILGKSVPNVSYDHWNGIMNRNNRGSNYYKRVIAKMAKRGK